MKIKTETKIGIIFLITLTLFIWGLNYLKGNNILKPTYSYYAIYENVRGLSEASIVTINGFHVGQIQNIYLAKADNKMLVEISLHKKYRIPIKSVAKIYSTDIMGTKAVQLVLSNNQDYHTPGDTLISAIEIDLIDQISEEVIPIKERTEHLLAALDTLIFEVFNRRTRKNLSESFESINATVKMIDQEKQRLQNMMINLEAITSNLKNNNKEISRIFSNISQISDSLVRSNIRSTIEMSYASVAEMNSILSKINKGEGSMGLLINNDSLYVHLDEAAKNLSLLLEDVKKQPKDYVHFSVFGRKNKKK